MSRPEFADGHDLADRLAVGDPSAFDEVFRIFLSPLCRYIYSYVRTWDVAEDLAQGVFLQLWVRACERNLPPIRSIQSYLYNAARCDALDHLRRQRVEAKHRNVSPAPDAHARIEFADWEEAAASRERLAALQRAVDDLPPRQREVMLLRLKQASYEEIAATLRLSVKTVDAHLQRAFATHCASSLPSSAPPASPLAPTRRCREFRPSHRLRCEGGKPWTSTGPC